MTWTGDRIHPKLYRLPRIKCSVALKVLRPISQVGFFIPRTYDPLEAEQGMTGTSSKPAALYGAGVYDLPAQVLHSPAIKRRARLLTPRYDMATPF